MIQFADTSFLCPLYRIDSYSPQADALTKLNHREIVLSSLAGFEFHQSLRLQTRQHGADKSTGISKSDAAKVLALFQRDTQTWVFRLVAPVGPEVHTLAEVLSAKHTETRGRHSADILRVATALQLWGGGFLTLDSWQKELVREEGLSVTGH